MIDIGLYDMIDTFVTDSVVHSTLQKPQNRHRVH